MADLWPDPRPGAAPVPEALEPVTALLREWAGDSLAELVEFASIPSVSPRSSSTTSTTMATVRETRAPYITRLSTSRPRLSVPSGCFGPGAWNASERFCTL